MAKKKKLFKGEDIHFTSNSLDDLYYCYVDQGKIRASFEKENVERELLFYRNKGNAFSIQSYGFASIGRYKAHFTAVEETVLFAFTQSQLYDISCKDPEIFYEFIYVCHEAFAQLGHRLSNTGIQAAPKRLLMWLQKLCSKRTPDEHGVYEIEASLTLQQIAEILSIHITTCTKIISALETLGIIHRTRTHIYVLDLDKVIAYSSDDATLPY